MKLWTPTGDVIGPQQTRLL